MKRYCNVLTLRGGALGAQQPLTVDKSNTIGVDNIEDNCLPGPVTGGRATSFSHASRPPPKKKKKKKCIQSTPSLNGYSETHTLCHLRRTERDLPCPVRGRAEKELAGELLAGASAWWGEKKTLRHRTLTQGLSSTPSRTETRAERHSG